MRHTKIWFDDLGDLILVDLDYRRYPYQLIEQYGTLRRARRFWRHTTASRALNTALLNAETFVDTLENRRAVTLTRPML